MASIRFIRDTSITRALPHGGNKTEKIMKGVVWDDVKESSANWWVGKGDAVRVSGGSQPAGRSMVREVPQLAPASSPFTSILEGIEDGDFDRVFDAFREVTEEDVEQLAITEDSKLVLKAARDEVHKTGTINDVALPDLTDAAKEASKAVQTPAAPALPGAPVLAVPKGKGGRKARA